MGRVSGGCERGGCDGTWGVRCWWCRRNGVGRVRGRAADRMSWGSKLG